MRSFLAILLPALLLLPPPANAWWEEGHQVVARVAAAQLTPSALKRVAALLEVDDNPAAVADALATAAIWADQVKTETHTESWHFVNLTWQDNRSNFEDRCAGDDCALARIRLFAAQLKANDPDADSRFSNEDALRFLVHFVGDLHQPLHSSSNADQGGNCELLESPIDTAANVHALWDGPLVSRLGGDDALLAAELNAEIAQMSEQQRAAESSGNVEDWAWDAHRLAMVNVYKRLGIPKEDVAFPASCDDAPDEIQQLRLSIDDQYLEDMAPIVRDQLKKAGLRLAKMLNDIF